jgi:hypothetical protein
MKRLIRNNGLSIAVFAIFLATLICGQLLTGWHEHNDDLAEHGRPPMSLSAYSKSPHFLAATMENWESEFLQMFVYVGITVFLFQKGSAESNDPDKPRGTRPVTALSPWPVRRGGLWKALYAHSLSGAFALLFLVSFGIHALSSRDLENERRLDRGEPGVSLREHLRGPKFWFESFQNWQSEFLAIGSMVVLSIFLRERGSPESKDLETPHGETGA